MNEEKKTWTIIILVVLAVNLAVTSVLLVLFIQRSNDLERKYVSVQRQLDDLENGQDQEVDITGQLSAFAATFYSGMEDTIDGVIIDVTDDITAQIETEISSVEDVFAAYDDDIQTIATELETLNTNVEKLSGMIDKIEEVTDAIKNFFGIG